METVVMEAHQNGTTSQSEQDIESVGNERETSSDGMTCDAPEANLKENGQKEDEKDDKGQPKVEKKVQKEFDADMEKQRLTRLNFLLEKTSLYSEFLSQKLSLEPTEETEDAENGNKKRKRKNAKQVDDQPIKKGKGKSDSASKSSPQKETIQTNFKQPALLTGGNLRQYQLKGVDGWCHCTKTDLMVF